MQIEELLARHLPHFERREGQQKMFEQVLSTFKEGGISLIEAQTGTGKSLAYLLPALLSAIKTGERTLISTNTIALQEQLMKKDIPLALQTLGVTLEVASLRGMQNYLCLSHLNEQLAKLPFLQAHEQEAVLRTETWWQEQGEGILTKSPLPLPLAVRGSLRGDPDTCSKKRCKYYRECPYYQAKREASHAKILVVNHHLLLIDLLHRMREGIYDREAILPPYQHIIIDEAHRLEEAATEVAAIRLYPEALYRLFSRLGGEEEGRLTLLAKAAEQRSIGTELSLLRRSCMQQVHDAFHLVEKFCKGKTLRIDSTLLHTPKWQQKVAPLLAEVANGLKSYASLGKELLTLLQERLSEEELERVAATRFEAKTLLSRLLEYGDALYRLRPDASDERNVRWIAPPQIVEAPLEVATMLEQSLFTPFHSVTLCSATLDSGDSFAFVRSQLGLKNKHIETLSCASPFSYKTQASLAVLGDLPLPTEPAFTSQANEALKKIILHQGGGTLVLFTSHQHLKEAASALASLDQSKTPLIVQGTLDRHTALQRFRNERNSVLLATYSFWEGVDIPGDSLRCVVIVKLPFSAPTDPLVEGRSRQITEEGKSAFFDYLLPMAVTRFKQGFGRLIRSQSDRGIVICLDRRLVEKAYGKRFLQSIPECERRVLSTEDLFCAT